MTTVAVDILTGFLGSGKTTLLRHVLDHGLRGQPVAVVMNEIGEVGIDGRVITGLSAVERMVELSSGCICCSIDDYRFDRAMQEIVETAKPHLIVIESTGLADPAALAERVRAAGLGLDAVITVVDAADAGRHLAEAEVATRQIEAADFLVVNKVDLVEARALARLERRLGRINPRAVRFRSVRGALDSGLLFATGAAAYRQRAAGAGAVLEGHLEADGIGSFLYRSAQPLEQGRFERGLVRLPPDVIRAKGIMRFAGRNWQCLFNYTCGRHELTWMRLPADTQSQAVFIGRNLDRHEPSIRSWLAGCEVAPDAGTAQAREQGR
jgi:G3E family GTPase